MNEYDKTGKMSAGSLVDGEEIFVKDQWKREYRFRITSFPVPTGIAWEAIELPKDDSPGHSFGILSDFDVDPTAAKQQIIRKIERGINRRHLKKRDGQWEIGERAILRGRIEWNDDFSDTEYSRIFVVDGKRLTIEEFGRLFEPWEGWHFHFKIIDRSDDDT